jgi:hypothetical protein
MPNARQIRRSEYRCFVRTRATASRRRTVLSSFPGDFFQDDLVDRQLRHGLLQPCVLGLQIPQALRLIHPQPAVALAPAEVRLLRYPDLLRRLRHRLALADQHIGLPKLVDDLFRRISLLRYLPGLLCPSLRNTNLDQKSPVTSRKMLEFWGGGGAQQFETVTDRQVKQLPADRPVWLSGRGNAWAEHNYGADAASGFRRESDALVLGAARLTFADRSLVMVRRHPSNELKAMGWITLESLASAEGLARKLPHYKLPHYGKYSWLGFSGTEPTNTDKGEWSTGDSPLRVDLRPIAERGDALPTGGYGQRAALARLPAVFDAQRMQRDIEWLADPAREGRGPGTVGWRPLPITSPRRSSRRNSCSSSLRQRVRVLVRMQAQPPVQAPVQARRGISGLSLSRHPVRAYPSNCATLSASCRERIRATPARPCG